MRGAFCIRFCLAMSVLATLLVCSGPLVAQPTLTLERVASGLSQPLFGRFAPGDTNRMFIAEKTGDIRILDLASGSISSTPYLDLSGSVSTNSERGLLGFAFHPDYASNGFIYVNYTDLSGDTVVERYTRSGIPSIADPGSANRVLGFAQTDNNHNGGWMGFGNDNLLYIATGDGGGSNDPGNNAQDITDNLLGKMLRVNVNVDDFPNDPNRNYAIPGDNPFVGVSGDDEIYAYGLRNPWRNSFDRETGDLYIADVGQGAREEIDVLLATAGGGQNFGWRLREGTIATPSGSVGGPRPPGNVDPIYDYSHGFGAFQGRSVTGGYVYRGPITALNGQYFFGDFVSNGLWSLEFDGTSDQSLFNGTNFGSLMDWTDVLTTDIGELDSIASFAEDEFGNLYIIEIGGDIYKITSGSIPEPGNALVLLVILATVARQRRR